jgi:two-component system phosphate regulon response regulator PhoB
MSAQTILVVEDEPDISYMIARSLRNGGFDVLVAENGQSGLDLAVERSPALLLLDWMLPVMDGLELLRRLRRDPRTARMPVIMLSARGEVEDRARGLDCGADDYLAKPFSPRELLSRIRAVLRRFDPDGTRADGEPLVAGPLTLDMQRHEIRCGERVLRLGPTEFRLLSFFMEHTGRVFSRDQLLSRVWGNATYIDERTVDVHIRRLRVALGDAQGLIQTVRGFGYRFSADA